MAYQIDDLLGAEQLVIAPADTTQVEYFTTSLHQLIGDEPIMHKLIESYSRFHLARLKHQADTTNHLLQHRKHQIAELIARRSTEQRTPEWYIQACKVLTASEFSNVFGSPLARGKLVMTKATTPTAEEIQRRCSQQLTAPSRHMTPFDWGIRFEPVVKQIYEHKYGVSIQDLGRLLHPGDPRIAASPDGLIVDAVDKNSPRIGSLIEIKCPISRELTDKIPEEYYMQMQLQLEVTGLQKCYYVETRFRSACSPRNTALEGPAMLEGVLWLVEHFNPDDYDDVPVRRYVYGPVGCPDLEEPPCHLMGQHDHIIERVPWALMQWNEIIVERSPTWWLSVQSALQSFWADVEKAGRGEFVLPESSRKKKAVSAGLAENTEAVCLIQVPGAAAAAAAVEQQQQQQQPRQLTIKEMFC